MEILIIFPEPNFQKRKIMQTMTFQKFHML